MTSVQCPDVQTRPTACLEWTRVTLDALQQLVPPFAAAVPAPMRRPGPEPSPPGSQGRRPCGGRRGGRAGRPPHAAEPGGQALPRGPPGATPAPPERR